MQLQDSFVLDETDLQIVNALQIDPRAPWSLVASVAEIDPTTAARRWRRLTDAGAAWISCYPALEPASVAALVEIDCEHGRTVPVAQLVARDPHAMSVHIKTGRLGLLVELVALNVSDLGRYLLDRLPGIEGIREVRSHPLIRVYADGGQWRLGALDAAAGRRLRAPAPLISPRALTEDEWDILGRLAIEPRITVAELAAGLGVSRATMRRRVDGLLGLQRLLRCDLARSLSGWPIQALIFASCPTDKVDFTARALAQLPEIRVVTSLAGTSNLFIGFWLRSLDQLQSLETAIVRDLSHVTVTDRSVVIRPVKLVGRLLDENGWTIGNVPVDVRNSPG